MKTKLLILSLLLMTSVSFAQVVANQVDDFEDNTPQSWTVGNPFVAQNQISLPTDGGPDGSGDQFFRYTTTGAPNGQGSRCLVFSTGAQWSGDFIGQGIVAIKLNVRANVRDLSLRVGFSDETTESFLPTTQVVTDPITITAGSGWQEVIISIQPSDLNVLAFGDGATPAEVLANVAEMRIFSQTLEDWTGEAGIPGDPTPRSMDLDNVTASTTLSTTDILSADEFSISPNPATSKLNVYLPKNSKNTTISVYDVLGKRVFSKSLDVLASTSIDVSNWNSGVYIIRISSDNTTQTKRFVKQ
ncbi:T9SS type A sorting domain-containing protein [Psychroserpens mesophilus]|uniref:T9SS type A sorting domain-containing protein n=1 Tax=Psychroserpens mesophilus TaxID=325473 RepID=UPI003D661B4B